MSEQGSRDRWRVSYPEHEKLAAVRDQSQAIGEFLDVGRWTLCELRDSGLVKGFGSSEPVMEYQPVYNLQAVLAEWFGIDRDALAREKDEMLEALRAAG